MLVSIHSRGELLVELEPPSKPGRSMFVVFGETQTILLSREEATDLYMMLGASLDELDRDDEMTRADRGAPVVETLEMFPVASA